MFLPSPSRQTAEVGDGGQETGEEMIHITTDNKLDVVYDYHGMKRVLIGLQQHGSDKIIPLPNPHALIPALNEALISPFEKEYIERRNK